MPEILTESFCERCGTRYTFESAAPRKTRRLGQIKTLSKGMKNWVMSDDTSLDEAMAAARNDDDRELTSHQLDAFHATFNFCMTCRQYTCGNCWNVAEGHCLTCAPHLGHEILPAPFPDQVPFEPIRIEAEAWPEVDLSAGAPANGNGNGNGAFPAELDPWASTGATDVEEILEIDPAARLAFLSGDTPTPVVEPEAAAPPPTAPPIAAPPLAASPSTLASTPPPAPAPSTPPTAAGIFRWPTADEIRTADPVAADAVADEPTPSAIADLAPEADVIQDASVIAAAALDAEPIADVAPGEDAVGPSTAEPLPPTVEGRTNLGATRTADLLRRFRPGQNIDAELAAYEAAADQAATTADDQESTEAVAAAPELQPETIAASAATEVEVVPAEVELVAAEAEPVAAVALEPEPVAAAAPEPEGEPVAAEAQAEQIAAEAPADPVAAEAAAEPVAAAEPIAAEPEPLAASPSPTPAPAPVWPAPASPPFPADQPREDRIPQPTWQIFAPDATPAVGRPLDGSLPPVAPAQPRVAASADPQWPVRPDQIESPAMALLANRRAGSPSDALWAASAQEVLARPAVLPAAGTTGVQPCSSCGLSLSATARFCRRCGTRQA